MRICESTIMTTPTVIFKYVKGRNVEKEVFYFKRVKLYLLHIYDKKVGFGTTQEPYVNI